MLNFTHYGIYPQLVTIACRAIQINFGFTYQANQNLWQLNPNSKIATGGDFEF